MTFPLRHLAGLSAIALAMTSLPAVAGTYTWIPAKRALSAGDDTQTIVITGTRIIWGPGNFDINPSEATIMVAESTVNSGSIGNAITQAKLKAVDLSDVCKNPGATNATKGITSSSDKTARWEAATNLFNIIQAERMWGMYGAAYGGINIIIDSKSYTGFKVRYADGATETWVLTPNWAVSSMRLFDDPAPGSLTPSTRAGCGK